MWKKTGSYLASLIIAIVLSLGVINCYSVWLDQQLEALDDKKVILNASVVKDKGLYLLQRSIRHGDFLLIGSSELGAPVPQNPINLFPNQELPRQIDKVGSASKQSLLDGILIGAIGADENACIAMVVSMQWFFNDDIDKKGTRFHFSEIQYYAFMRNDKISEDDKVYVSGRLAKLLEGEDSVRAACLYANLHSQDTIMHRLGQIMLYPYFEGKYALLRLKDKYVAYKYLKDAKGEDIPLKHIEWSEEQDKATAMGREKCTNNNLYVYDEYYDKYLETQYSKLKDYLHNQKLLTCKETDDYRFFLRTANAVHVKPYMIFMSVNGWYYDYVGIGKNKRYEFYDWLAKETVSHGIEYLDTRAYEYSPYFYCDVMHLGWKGWLYVGENVSKHFCK